MPESVRLTDRDKRSQKIPLSCSRSVKRFEAFVASGRSQPLLTKWQVAPAVCVSRVVYLFASRCLASVSNIGSTEMVLRTYDDRLRKQWLLEYAVSYTFVSRELGCASFAYDVRMTVMFAKLFVVKCSRAYNCQQTVDGKCVVRRVLGVIYSFAMCCFALIILNIASAVLSTQRSYFMYYRYIDYSAGS